MSPAQGLGDSLPWIRKGPLQSGNQRTVYVVLNNSRDSWRIVDTIVDVHRSTSQTRIVLVLRGVVRDWWRDSLLQRVPTTLDVASDGELLIERRRIRSLAVPMLIYTDDSGTSAVETMFTDSSGREIRAFDATGIPPFDISRPLVQSPTSRIICRARPNNQTNDVYQAGVTGQRFWIRSATRSECYVILAWYTEARFSIHTSVSQTYSHDRFDLDVYLPSGCGSYAEITSLYQQLDSVFGMITILSKKPYSMRVLHITDPQRLQRRIDPNGVTLPEFVRDLNWVTKNSIMIDTLIDDCDTRYQLRANEFHSTTMDSVLSTFGLAAPQLMYLRYNIASRSKDLPEEALHEIPRDRTRVVPVIAMSLVDAAGRNWGGCEIGAFVGPVIQHHGIYNLIGYRVGIEGFTNGEKVIGGLTAGAEYNHVFVLRARIGIYTDFQQQTSLSFLPDVGIGVGNHLAVTAGVIFPISGSRILANTFRLGMTWSILWDPPY